MATVSTLVELFGISKHTARTWAQEFAPYLSAGAAPPRGERRRFSEDDLTVFALVAYLRGQNASYADIHDALAAGDRMNVPQPMRELAISGRTGASAPLMPSPDFAPVEIFQLFAEKLTQQYQAQIQELRQEIDRIGRERDYFRNQYEALYQEIKAAQAQTVAAATTIARQETELAALSNLQQQLKEERTARMNAANQLAAAQARAEKLEALLDSAQPADKGGRSLFARK